MVGPATRHRSLRSALQRGLLVALIVIGYPAAPEAAPQPDQHKQILVLYSTRRDGQFSMVGETELPRLLDVGLGRNLDYYSEFMDVARFPDPSYKEAFRSFIRQKYQGVRFDLVIAMHDVALQFLDEHREALFADTPLVYLTNNRAYTRGANATGVTHDRNFTATLTLLRQLQPEVTRVFVVTGAAVSDRVFENEVRAQLQSSDSGLAFTYLSGLRTADLVQRLSRLPAQSAVYHILMTEDGAGDRFHPLEYVDRVAAAANAPTYSWVDSTMGRGIIGGSLYSQRAAVEHVGQLALRVLRGEAAGSIAASVVDLNVNQVDWRQLRRWHIDERRVPAGTIVSFRDPTIWDRYKVYILGAAVVLVTQSVLITGLLIQRRRRYRAEAQLRASERNLRRSFERNRDLAARLLQAQETEHARIARELHDDISQRMVLLTIELESLRRAHHDEAPAEEAFSIAQGIAKSLHELSHRLHPAKLRLIGLVAALDHLRLDLSRAGIPIAFSHDHVPATLSPDLMLCLYRIVQEALQNAIKYSQATAIAVHLSGAGGALTLTVRDNGVGFDVDQAWSKGLGLSSMTERLDAVGGSLDLRSKPGAGTEITVTIPPHAVRPAPRVAASAVVH